MSEDSAQHLTRVKTNLERRTAILEGIRAFFREEDFLEVDTPLLLREIIPEQHITPFIANGHFLATSPEIFMKQMLAAGYGNIFQLCHCFRKGERGRRHRPEFTILEWYRTGADYLKLIEDTERLVSSLANRLGYGTAIDYQGQRIDLTPPWPRLTLRDAFLKAVSWDPVANPDAERCDIDLMAKVVPAFAAGRPAVLCDYPAALASLSRLKPADPMVAERAEVFIGGLEIANAYTELNDAAEQAERFRHEIEALERQGRHITLPEHFLAAIRHLPECAGIALGVDRLVMLLCDAASIDAVLPFP
ncbi:MAG: EF-P lysine aminoacylase GenX [Chloroflexi bacterium]|nr:EF-P lysine aminoacylase GenX [Chloroflexota bacterium]